MEVTSAWDQAAGEGSISVVEVTPAAPGPRPATEESALVPVRPAGRRSSLLRVPQRRHTITKVQNIQPSCGGGSLTGSLGTGSLGPTSFDNLLLPPIDATKCADEGRLAEGAERSPRRRPLNPLTRLHPLAQPPGTSSPGSGDRDVPEDQGTLVLPEYLVSCFTPSPSKQRKKVEHYEEFRVIGDAPTPRSSVVHRNVLRQGPTGSFKDLPPLGDDEKLPMVMKPTGRKSPPARRPSAIAIDTDDFMDKVQAKLEREALLREEGSEGFDFREVAPDIEAVPWPSPVLLSPRASPQRSPRAHSPADTSNGGESPLPSWTSLPLLEEGSRRGSLSSAPSIFGDESPFRSQDLQFERDFKPGATIGAGSFGRVITAQHRSTGLVVAVKEIVLSSESSSRASSKARSTSDEDAGAGWARECRLCEQLRHPCIVTYLGHELSDVSGGVPRLRLFLEYCSGGSIASQLNTFGAYEAPVLARYSQQVLSGLEYLHTRSPQVVHRDLKCANLLLTHESNAKIADFGCSKWLKSRSERSQQDTMVGSVFWTAPEMLRGRSELSTAVDLWSFGCCILEMATGKHPWSEHPIDNIFQACCLIVDPNRLPDIPQHLPEEVREAIGVCVRHNASQRATPAELWELPLFSSASFTLASSSSS